MSLMQLLISVTGVLGLALLARFLRLGEGKILDEEAACRIAEDMLAGFEARRAIISKDGDAALVAGNGTVAVLKRHGTRVAARRLVPPVVIRDAVEGATIATGERLFGDVTLLNVFPDDARALAAPLTLV